MKKNNKILLKPLIFGAAIASSAAAYGPVYAFHILALLYLLTTIPTWLLNGTKLNSVPAKAMLIFLAFATFTSIWSPDKIYAIKFIFYLSCGYLIIAINEPFGENQEGLHRLYRYALISGYILLIVGTLESTGLFRMPTSPYSDFAYLFGKSDEFMSEWSPAMAEYNLSKPTGLSGNPNTFGFCLLLFLPFLITHHNTLIRATSLLAAVFTIYTIDSRTLFAGIFLMYYFWYAIYGGKYSIITSFVIIPATGLLALTSLTLLNLEPNNRILYTALNLGTELSALVSPDDAEVNSAAYRGLLYLFGIEEYIKSGGLGIGIGGIESLLFKTYGQHIAFHNFYLQILVDLGPIGLLLFSSILYKTIKHCHRVSINARLSSTTRTLAKSTLLSILVSIFTSLSPSGIFYSLPFWALIAIGFALIRFSTHDRANHINAHSFSN